MIAKRVSSVSLLTLAAFLVAAPLFAANAGISFGPAQRSEGKIVVPVLLATGEAGDIAAYSLRFRSAAAAGITIRGAQGLTPGFEVAPRGADSFSYVAWFNEPFKAGANFPIAEIEISNDALRNGDLQLVVDTDLTTLSDAAGVAMRSVGNGQLTIPATLEISRDGREKQHRQ